MDRRRFVALIGGALAAPLARAQRSRRRFRVAHVSIDSLEARMHLNDGLELGLRELGYRIGEGLVLEQAAGDGSVERLQVLVRETVARKPDVIVTGANVVTLAVKSATQRIPIVMALGTDVVGAGLVRSLRRPGGNVTGVAIDAGDGIATKQVGLLKELAPRTSRVAVLWEPPHRDNHKPAIDKAAASLGLGMTWVQFSDDLEHDFGELRRARCNALHVLAATGIHRRAAEIFRHALQLRLPNISDAADFVKIGGLMSYGANLAGAHRAAARHVDKILKGAKPGEIPVEQPTAIDLTLNLKTAKALGLTIPQSLLSRASRVID